MIKNELDRSFSLSLVLVLHAMTWVMATFGSVMIPRRMRSCSRCAAGQSPAMLATTWGSRWANCHSVDSVAACCAKGS
eukprot:scaffold57417_cov26-Attheya_sp.AAC.1